MLQVAIPEVVKPVFQSHDFVCYLTYGLIMTFSVVNVLTMAIMAVTRYLHISNSRYYRLITIKSNIIIITCAWLLALCLSLPPTFQSWGNFQYYPLAGICIISFADVHGFPAISYVISLIIIFYLVPTAIISICYYKIYSVVHNSKQRVNIYSRRKSICRQQSYRQKDIRLSITIFIIFLTFIISYTPFVVSNFLELLGVVRLSLQGKFLAKYFTFINCTLNPVIFSLRTRRMRRFFHRLKGTKSTPVRPIHVELIMYSGQYSSHKQREE